MTACNVACCEKEAVKRSMCAAHDEYFHPRTRPDETWRTTPYEDRPPATAGTHALATHVSRAQAVLDVFTGTAFAVPSTSAHPAVDLTRPARPLVWRPCETCTRQIGQLPPAAWRRRPSEDDMAPCDQRRFTGGPRPTEDEEREHRAAIRAIRTHCLKNHRAIDDEAAA